ncbi:DsbA family protein [Asticcacaulis sp. 201]|uniref:DsbA family protein n=1 Tax=Asticcacaulis sp. 201 TaxID=3028787 RepID=UPI0029169F8F|nr:DsbA family protein [Asticcacaulis sp. 201]MDV6330785.1 DsbA family protein [Asticcacaulis sp. 201]
MSADAVLSRPVGADDHRQGPDTAPVTLVEYGDYECVYCGEAYPVLKAVQAELGDKLRFVFRNFPLVDLHPHAFIAAEAAEASGAQGKFWEMHDMLYEHQSDLSPAAIVDYAERLGLDLARFVREVNNQTYAKRIETAFQDGIKSGVTGTPSLFINGDRYDGARDTATLVRVLKAAFT